MSTVRLLRGDPRIVDMPKASADAIKMGDLLHWVAGSSGVRPFSLAAGGNFGAKAGAAALDFVGVAMADRDAGDTGRVPVATAGDYLFPTTGSPAVMARVGASDNSGTPRDQTVAAATTNGTAIGRVINVPGTGFAEVRISSKLDEIVIADDPA
jgi:predicted RecA/RadA family phage recombinase